MYRNKSLPLALLMPLFERLIDLDLIELHCLRLVMMRAGSSLAPSREIHEWHNRLTDFSDTAHVVRQLDLVILLTQLLLTSPVH